jgi:transcriptional regulator with XRE-family HTH domain
MSKFSKNLARIRDERGYNHTELAAKLGVSIPIIGRWESGKVNPLPDRYAEIADALGVSLDKLMR